MKQISPAARRRRAKRKDALRGLCFLAPSLLGVAVFFVAPFVLVLRYSLTDINGSFVKLQNFAALVKNPVFRMAAKNTLVFSAAAVPLSVALAIVLALLLECRIPMKSTFRSFFLSPIMVPVASVVLIWQVLFSSNGTVNVLVTALGGTAVDWLNSEYAPLVVLLLFLWKNLGYNMILFMAGLANIPRDLLEVAEVEGASAAYRFFAIKLRYLSPTVLFTAILSLISSFKIFREVWLLAGNYPYESIYTLQHFMNNMFNALDYQRLSAAAVLMALVMIAVIALLFAVEDRFGKDVEG